ncbi:carbonic anhydrase [Belliella kenyensis]|uniref:carbonic anhydrase n=1 Tax=Belliella kenyensis TaxID=1472724 RepID=A0ABV8EPC4_9BACT|nr:carbonic anhydrase [Belliella kenyensis]MCH7401526.1 carbonic anhydrase [Belliella kenyensis]MDN3603194.1 carbonic anhydrase [Belliella kenyensis]
MRQIIMIVAALALLSISCKRSSEDQHLENIPTDHLLETLLNGNKRFASDHPIHPDQGQERLKNLAISQHPAIAIVSCSDSRVSPELIFDQGLGDLFVIRNAGNIVSDNELGSIAYSIEHLGVSLVVILGHTKCGAIGAFVEHDHNHEVQYSEFILKIIDFINQEEEEKVLLRSDPDFYQKAIEANVLHGIHEIKNKIPMVEKLINDEKLILVGAIYDVDTREVIVIKDAD